MADRTEAAGRSMRPHDPIGTFVAVGFVVLGIVLIVSTGSMTPLGSVFPITISAAMIVFSLVLIVRNVILGTRRSPAAAAEPAAEPSHDDGSIGRRLVFLVLMGAWIALIPVLGFFVASLAAFFAIMAAATHERMSIKETVALVVIGLVIVTGFYLVMAEVLLIPMPRGLFF